MPIDNQTPNPDISTSSTPMSARTKRLVLIVVAATIGLITIVGLVAYAATRSNKPSVISIKPTTTSSASSSSSLDTESQSNLDFSSSSSSNLVSSSSSSSNSVAVSSSSSMASGASTSSISSFASTAPQSVTVKLVKANYFTREVSSSKNNCGYEGGIVTYVGKASTLSVRSSNLNQTKVGQQKLAEFKQYLDGGAVTESSMLSMRDGFRVYCSGYYTKPVRELKNIAYPNTDQVRIQLAYEGQSDLYSLGMYVFARKGDSIILISKQLFPTDAQQSTYYDSCLVEGETFSKVDDACLQKKLLSPANITLATSEAQRLISDYALE